MKKPKAALLAVALGAALAVQAADNLVVNGDFSDEAMFRKECRCPSGKLTLGVEDATWNRFGRVEVTEAVDNRAKGTKVTVCRMRVGVDPKTGKAGFPVVPGEVYEYSAELKGRAYNAFVSVYAWREDGDESRAKPLPLAVPRIDGLTDAWTAVKGTFQVPAGMTRASVSFSLWWDTVWGPERIRVGDWLGVDNVSVRLRKGHVAAFAKAYGKPFVAVPVPVTVDARVPFVPEEIYAPVSNIAFRAAVNERTALPIAVANLTDRFEEYRVILETTDPGRELVPMSNPPPPSACNGSFGLNGFPADQIVQRRGVVVKDTEEDRDLRRIDPLEKTGEARAIAVPPQEAGLVWFDFDTAGVKPGRYAGRLRVIPLSEPMKRTSLGNYNRNKYEGAMQDVPVELTVLPIELPKDPVAPGGFYGNAASREMFREMLAMGAREFQVSTWAFRFDQDAEGNLKGDPQDYRPYCSDARAVIRDHLRWAAEADAKIRFFVGYSCYTTFCTIQRLKPGSEQSLRLWPQWVKAVTRFMNAQGLSDADYALELWDEPKRATDFEILKTTARLAAEAAPTACRLVTFHHNPWTNEDLDALFPYLNGWIFYDGKFLRESATRYADVFAKIARRGDLFSHYTCSTRMQEDLDREFRQNAWVAAAHGLNGNHIYQVIEASGGPGAPNWKTKQNGGLLYRSFGDFLPSLRSLALRRGVEDVKYLKVLQDVGKDSPEAQAFLKDAAWRVVRNPSGGDRRLADRVRDEAARLTLKMSGKLAEWR